MAVEVHVRDRMLEHGYFASQLSPLFTTRFLAGAASQIDRNLDVRTAPGQWTEPVRFSSAKLTGLRRPLAIPNPGAYLRVVDDIATHWPEYSGHWDKSSISLTRPRLSTEARGIDDRKSFREREKRRLSAATRSRFRLTTDVALCYSSIYTHSLSWALGGKTAAKAAKNNPDFSGNSLDKAIQEAQDGQTMGVPIGPESSLAAAEIILCAVDERLQKRGLTYADAFRAIDDYEVFVQTRSEAERFLAVLEHELAQFGLTLNASKTSIEEAPFLIEDRWKSRLIAMAPPDRNVGRRHVQAFINEVFALAGEYPNDSVAGYAWRMADSLRTGSSGDEMLIEAALATLRFSPPSIRQALWCIMNRLERLDLDRSNLWTCLNDLAFAGASLEHSYEVTWALWGLLVAGGRLEPEPSAAVSRMQDPFSLVAYMRLQELGLVDGPTPERLKNLHAESLTEASDAWILAYEAQLRGWADPGSIASSPFFNRLQDLGVTFIDEDVGPLELEEGEDTFDLSDFDLDEWVLVGTPYE